MEGGGVSALTILGILLRAAVFLGCTAGLGYFFSARLVRLAAGTGHPEMMLVFGLAACFTLAFVAELIGLAGIIGAFAAGLLRDPHGRGVRTSEHDATLADPTMLLFAGVLTLCAVAGKLACGWGVLAKGANRLAVGIAMVPRGEVGLIFAGIGATLMLEGRPILSGGLFAAVVLMVLLTTLAAPVGLRWGAPPNREPAWRRGLRRSRCGEAPTSGRAIVFGAVPVPSVAAPLSTCSTGSQETLAVAAEQQAPT